MLHEGYREEAEAWRDWLLRAVAGDPAQMQIMYGVAGERHLEERTLDWLPGYAGSRPVRIGNAAAVQRQLDVHGEVLDTLHQARRLGVSSHEDLWPLQRSIAEWLESNWRKEGESIWEIRAPRRDFTFSKVMAWVAMDRVVKAVEEHGMDGPVDRWRRTRDEIHDDVCRRGYDADRGSFTQAYGAKTVDAALLLIPTLGFLPASDPRVAGTIAAVERTLLDDGFVLRYPTGEGSNLDGLHGREGAFLACSFWLVDAYVLSGRREEAVRLFERIRAVRNDVGLLSEEYDPRRRRLVGNFPQAFSHVAHVNSIRNLTSAHGPARSRRET
jgi:GH15 family glucan-1,4-alpha-glucosidase